MRRGRGGVCGSAAAIVAVLLMPPLAAADPLIPGPGEAGHDADLAAKLARFERQIHGVMTVPLGWGLEAYVADQGARDQIAGFVASDAATFEEFSGQHIYAVLDQYEEFGDLGMFGGVQAAGDAFRYAVLRDEGGDPVQFLLAREQLLAAMDGLHWYSRITGTPGVVARGLRRAVPQAGAPPLPGVLPETVPLFDAMGDPLPVDKEPTWREDVSGELPELIWMDDTSKDQLIGYVFALGVVYDVVANDDSIPPELVDRLVEDARALALSLMQPRRIGDSTIDLVIVDADGRPTSFFDLAAEVLTPDIINRQPTNPFNAIMALGAMRTLYQITGDAEIGTYYYDELIEARGYLDLAEEYLWLLWFGDGTNHSNVNMAFVAIYPLLRYEPELDIAMQVRDVLATHLYGPDPDGSARGLQQSFFDLIMAGFGTEGSTGVGETALADGLALLVGHPDAPYWDPAVDNCDDAEIAAGMCTAIDGSTIVIADGRGWGGGAVAADPLPIAIRPPTNFRWRSNPHQLNGGGSTRLNPGGEIYAAYWMGRRLLAGDDGFVNISPDARGRPGDPDPDPDPDTGSGADSTGTGDVPPDATTEPSGSSMAGGSTDDGTSSPADDPATSDGCACTMSPDRRATGCLLALLFAGARRRRRA